MCSEDGEGGPGRANPILNTSAWLGQQGNKKKGSRGPAQRRNIMMPPLEDKRVALHGTKECGAVRNADCRSSNKQGMSSYRGMKKSKEKERGGRPVGKKISPLRSGGQTV